MGSDQGTTDDTGLDLEKVSSPPENPSPPHGSDSFHRYLITALTLVIVVLLGGFFTYIGSNQQRAIDRNQSDTQKALTEFSEKGDRALQRLRVEGDKEIALFKRDSEEQLEEIKRQFRKDFNHLEKQYKLKIDDFSKAQNFKLRAMDENHKEYLSRLSKESEDLFDARLTNWMQSHGLSQIEILTGRLAENTFKQFQAEQMPRIVDRTVTQEIREEWEASINTYLSLLVKSDELQPYVERAIKEEFSSKIDDSVRLSSAHIVYDAEQKLEKMISEKYYLLEDQLSQRKFDSTESSEISDGIEEFHVLILESIFKDGNESRRFLGSMKALARLLDLNEVPVICPPRERWNLTVVAFANLALDRAFHIKERIVNRRRDMSDIYVVRQGPDNRFQCPAAIRPLRQ